MNKMNMCRVCRSTSKAKNYTRIYGDDVKIAKDIFEISAVQIIEFFAYDPAMICDGCLTKLKISTEFKKSCKQSDDQFRKCFKKEELKLWSANFSSVMSQDKQEILPSVKHEIDSDDGTQEMFEDFVVEALDEALTFPCKEDVEASGNKEDLKAEKSGEAGPSTSSKSQSTKGSKRHRKKSSKLNIQCIKCNGSYDTLYKYDRHMDRIHGTGTFHCDLCDKVFNKLSELRRHLSFELRKLKVKNAKAKALGNAIKKQPKTFEKNEAKICITCGFVCNSSRHLKSHEITHMIKAELSYIYCDICGNKFQNKYWMKYHMKRRHIEKVRHTCPYDSCSRSYLKRAYLTDHIKTFHEKIFDFHCEFCGKGFAAKWKLTTHTRIHTGETKYECKYCGQRFIQNTDCRRHEWKHTGFKGNIQCPNCKERFMKKSDLQNHLNRCPRY